MKKSCIILAAGDGKRMKSAKPKVLCEILFEPMLGWVLSSVKAAGFDNVGVVVGNGAEAVKEYLTKQGSYKTFLQAERKGTGHAVMQAAELIRETEESVLVLCGDAPFIDKETIENAYNAHISEKREVTVISAETEPFGYGRIVRGENGSLKAIVEEKDCTEEQRKIREVNSGAYIFSARALERALPLLTDKNAAGEFYLTDTVAILNENAGAYKTANSRIILGANSRAQLYDLNETAAEIVMKKHMELGVSFVGKSYIGRAAEIGADTVILPNTVIMGKTVIGSGCTIGPNSFLTNTIVGDNVLLDNVKSTDAEVESGAKVGPFVHLRPNTLIKQNVKIGDFVEVKNSVIGEKTSLAHLTYIGDSDVGSGVNFGCGCVTANYDGINKFRTKIGNDAFIGCNTNLIAPVEIGDNATTAAGSTITENVPANALAIERGKQYNKLDWEMNFKRPKKK